MPTSPQTLEFIVPLLKDLAKAKQQSAIARAATSALVLNDAAERNPEKYQEVAADACQFVFVVADQLREKRKRDIDYNLKSDLESVTSIFEEIKNLAQPSTSQNDFSAFWGSSSDSEDLEALQAKLEQSLRAFNIQNFSELRNNANQRVQALNPSSSGTTGNSNNKYGQEIPKQPGNVVNQGSGDVSQQGNNIAMRDGGTVHAGNHYGPQMFSHVNGAKIEGGNFNNIAGNVNKTDYHGKNISANYGKLYGQNLGDGGNVNFSEALVRL